LHRGGSRATSRRSYLDAPHRRTRPDSASSLLVAGL
jgi:hypothetical protein